MNKQLVKKISAYSAIAASMAGLSKGAHAQVIYTDIPDTLLSQGINFLFLDLNNDGVFDFRFKAGNFNTTYLSVVGLAAGNSVIASTVNSSFSVVYPVRLDYADAIDVNKQWPPHQLDGFLAGGTGGDANFDGAKDAYLGIRFMTGSEQHYGWIRLDVDADAQWLLIKDFAYNAIANAPIGAGQITAQLCNNWYEPNNSPAHATPVQPGTDYQAMIAKGSDHDFYTFPVAADQPNVKISLTNLPKNYNLRLYDSNGQKLDQSNHNQTQDETLVANNMIPGNYYALVYPKDGTKFDASQCYSLRIETSDQPFKISSETAVDAVSLLNIFPNPVSDWASIQFSVPENSDVLIDLFDLQGRKIKTIVKGNFEAGLHHLLLQKENLNSGIYFLQLRSGNGIATLKLVVQ